MPMNSRRPRSLQFAAVATAILVLALLSSDASAKKKRLTFGCTDAQVQSTACDVGTVIVQDHKIYTKILYCDSGGHTQCCVADDHSNIIDSTCHVLTLTQRPPTDRAPRPGKFEQTTTTNPNGGRTTAPGLLEQNNGLPGGLGPSPTGSPPARSSAPSFQ